MTSKLKKNTTYVNVNGQYVKALVDSGADYSVVSEELRRRLNAPMFIENGPILNTASGEPVAASGRCILKVNFATFRRGKKTIIRRDVRGGKYGTEQQEAKSERRGPHPENETIFRSKEATR